MTEGKFDNEAYAKMSYIATSAKLEKAKLATTNEVQTYNLTGFTEIQCDQGRMSFPGKAESSGFNVGKLMMGIIAGDFTDTETEEVKVYYPHKRYGQLVGKTVFVMKLDDAVMLLERCSTELQIPTNILKQAVDGYTKAMSFAGQADFKLHEKDIVAAISSKLNK